MTILKPGEYRWKETQGGTGWVLLRHDVPRGTQTRLLRYTRGISLPAVELTHTVEWLVLRGEARCGDRILTRRGFHCWRSGERRPEVAPGEDGYTVLSFAYQADDLLDRPGVAIASVDTLPWSDDEPWQGAGALPMRLLSQGPGEDSARSMLRLDPGVAVPPLVVPTILELFVIEGIAGLEGEKLVPATYVAVEPAESFGPLTGAGAAPAVLLVYRHASNQ